MTHGSVAKALLAFVYLGSGTAMASGLSAVPGEYVVKLRPESMHTTNAVMAQSLGSSITRVVSKEGHVVLVKRAVIENSDSAIQTLSQNPNVELVEPNFIYHASGGATVTSFNDPRFADLWGMKNTGQATKGDGGEILAKQGVDIQAVEAWAIETGSKDVVVAVIDTGVDYKNPDLADNIWTNAAEANGKAGIDDDNNGFVDDIHGYDFSDKDGDPMDGFGHGTHCSGTIGAGANNGVGVVGVNWNVSIMPVRFLGSDGSGSLDGAISAIDYATKMKANIMSNSWGGGPFSQTLLDAITRARAAGILFVVAAGNESNNNDATPSYPASYSVDNILSVAAIDARGSMADFSNYGAKSVHVAAPGVNIVSDVLNNALDSWSGTSMATPHVAGVAALLKAHEPAMTYLDLKTRIMNTARPLAALRGKVQTGGMVNAYLALTNTLSPADPDDPFAWKAQPQAVSSDHPYAVNLKKEWKFKVKGATRVALHFSKFETEAGYDIVEFKDKKGNSLGKMSGIQGDTFSPVAKGDEITISFASDKSNTAYGFDVAAVAYQ